MKNQNAVTIVSLIVTIIVLLILITVSIGLLLGENGIITNARQTQITNSFAEYKEKASLAVANEIINEVEISEERIIRGDNIDSYVPDIDEEYKDKIAIYGSELIFIGIPTEEEEEVLKRLDIEYYESAEIFELIENEILSFSGANPPEDGIWKSGSTVMNLGTGVSYDEEKECFIQQGSLGRAGYISTEPFNLNYDNSFTIEYVFKINNILTYNSDIEIMSLQGVNSNIEHILFYTNAMYYERWFSMYSHPSGLLAGTPYRDKANSPSPRELYNEPITIGLIYDKNEGKVKQYVNGELNRQADIRGNISGEQLVKWSNTRLDPVYNQQGIAGEVYYLGIYEMRVSDELMLINHQKYLEEYNK